jgi:hypothetical protein
MVTVELPEFGTFKLEVVKLLITCRDSYETSSEPGDTFETWIREEA